MRRHIYKQYENTKFVVIGPYKTNGKNLDYVGNNIFQPIRDILGKSYSTEEFESRVKSFESNKYWTAISKINHRINISINEYFSSLGALFTLLPLTTRMISSPGAVYGKEAINYTTDTCPITLQWFDYQKIAFLSESSQIYLELSLIQHDVDHVYSIYNSFRKELADATHLCEFHHVEYEGNILQERNIEIAINMIKKIVADLLQHNLKELKLFLSDEKIDKIKQIILENGLKIISFKEALEKLYDDTNDEKYKKFTLKNFGSWEEVRLTELYNSIIGIKEFPILEVPFYHAVVDNSEPEVANNLDIIWPGYIEILGSGQRVGSIQELEKKSELFNLPKDDYKPYLESRQLNKYKVSSGFGLGWERLLHGLLEMPFIWSANHFPRVNKTLKI